MNRKQIFTSILKKQSYLCIGLDPDPALMPDCLDKNCAGMLEFNRQIIKATENVCVAYKLNLAFYESMGAEGWKLYEDTLSLISPDQFIIADAKRGDIGNTSAKYAAAFFDPSGSYRVDALTVNPYMGRDSVIPFLSAEGKWVIALALTSNAGAEDFQKLKLESGELLYEQVIRSLTGWASPDQLMLVTGATRSAELQHIREMAPDYFLLVPGIGAQGGNLEEVSRLAMNKECGLLVNVGRSVLYASKGTDYAEMAAAEAASVAREMAGYLKLYL